ncbi:MAG: T9SS type A sorting domain-containing protein [Saprospiraceae bacterium]|nr:T9SS type A sorting domain-containing protein [Saprospiraceae bacterium]
MKEIIVFFIMCQAACLTGQTGYNSLIDLGYPTNHFLHMCMRGDTIIGYGVAYKDTTQWQQGVLLVKLDSSGQIIDTTLVLDSFGDHLTLTSYYGDIIATTDGGYAMTTSTFYRNSVLLIKVDEILNIEFIKEFPDSINLTNYFWMLTEAPNGYLLYGLIQRPDYFHDGFIRYVDKTGETIWFKYLTTSNFDNGVLDLEMTSDTTFVAGMVNGTSASGAASSLWRYHIDGTLLDFWQSDSEPEMGYLREIIPASDGGLITYGLYVAYIVPNSPGLPGTKMVQSTLTKFDTAFQIQWVRHFGPIKSLNSNIILREFVSTPDGNYVGAGETSVKVGDEPSRRVGWLYKFSPEGDSIWSREVDAPLPLEYINSGVFGGVGVLSSGSIVAGGAVNEGTKKYCWLVKVSADGCLDTLWCQAVAAPEVWVSESALPAVFPNPATYYLGFKLPDDWQGARVQLLAPDGRVLRHTANPADGMDVSELPAGLYFCRFLEPGGTEWVKKVILMR